MFSLVHDSDVSAIDFDHDVEKNSEWAFQWKMRLNPDLIKQDQEKIFRMEKTVSTHPVVYFNSTLVNSTTSNKQGNGSSEKTSSNNYSKKIIVTIYKSLRPHIGYGDEV